MRIIMLLVALHGALWLSFVTCLAYGLSPHPQNDKCRAKALPSSPAEASTSTFNTKRRDVDFMSSMSSSSSSSCSSGSGSPKGSNTKTRRTRDAHTPLVDSTLLRFLSTQRQTPDTFLPDATAALPPVVQQQQQQQQQQEDRIRQQQQNEQSNYYMYNHVAQTLLAMTRSTNNANAPPISKETALLAAESVQRHVVVRTARRRLRLFLKRRDTQLWASSSSSSPSEKKANTTTTTTSQWSTGDSGALEEKDVSVSQHQYFDLEQVIELLMVEHGLTPNDICTILTHTPSVALMRLRGGDGENTLERTCHRVLTELLSESLALRKYDARKVVRNCPGLLTVKGSKNAQQVVALLSACGVSHTSLARDKHVLVTLLSRSPAALFRLVSFFSSNAIRMPLSNIGPLLRRAECVPLLNAIAPPLPPTTTTQTIIPQRLPSSPSQPQPGQSQSSSVAVAERRRQDVNDVYRNMTATAWTLRHVIGTCDLGKVISAYPSVLLLDAEKHILPAASYLMEDLGMMDDDLPRVLQLYPALLGMNVDDMKRVSSYLVQSLEVADENLASIFRAFPSLLTLDVERDIMPVIQFLREIGISNVGRFVTRLPPILGYSVQDELVPKWEYLRKVSTPTQASFELSTFPAYFSYPLDRVIKTRYEYLLNEKRIPTQFLALDVVLRYGDVDFATQVARDADGGACFQKFAERRQRQMMVARQSTGRRKASTTTKKGRRGVNNKTAGERRNNATI